MSDRQPIVLLNDRHLYNSRYRASLIAALVEYGFEVHSIGLFDGPRSLLIALKYILFSNRKIVTSNLRANIFFLLFFWRSGLVIFNGLGRHRQNKIVRCFLISLLRLNTRKRFSIQNYADFRYFRRFWVNGLSWVPGSGGSRRPSLCGSGLFVVTRPEKLKVQYASIVSAMNLLKIDSVAVVGVAQGESFDFPSTGLEFRGYVEQSSIFLFGDVLLHPEGYGEGLPHSLVDALCSGISIIISKQDFLRYGLSKFGIKSSQIKGDWVNLIYDQSRVSLLLGVDHITEMYVRLI